LLVGCTQIPECPIVTCKPCETPVVDEARNTLLIYKIDGGYEDVYAVANPRSLDIYNCGNEAHGIITSQKIRDILSTRYILGNLYVLNTNNNFIGGCVDILKDFPEIRNVYLYGKEANSKEYDSLIEWSPVGRTFLYNTGNFSLEYNGHEINFSRVNSALVETDGEVYTPIN